MGPPADDEGVPWPRRVRLSGLVPYHLSTATQRPLGCQALQEEESFFFVVPSHLLDPPTEGEPGCTSSAILKPCLRLRIVRSFATLYCLFRLPRPAVSKQTKHPTSEFTLGSHRQPGRRRCRFEIQGKTKC